MITLRPYQQAALEAVVAACQQEKYLLLQAATGAGKTILFSKLIETFITQYQMRILVLAHREILVRQAYQKLVRVWPEAALCTGLACKSVSGQVELERPVVIGSPQTILRRLGEMPPVHLVIVDEAHRLPPRHRPSQYREMIEGLERYYPQLRLLGVTATPYILNHGYIYGAQCKPGNINWFPRLHFQISIGELIEQGYLVPYLAREAKEMASELAKVRTTAGEYNLNALGDLMGREVHIKSAVQAYEQWGEGRKHVVVFCVTIAHAEKVAEAFARAGYASGVVHSKQPRQERRQTLARFERGELQVIANMGVLTEGWDSTAVDCILLCRPTLSPALYVQMVGRGLRPHPGKKDLLILDLGNNCRYHGDPDHPHVHVPNGKKKKSLPLDTVRARACPNCGLLNPLGAAECSHCGYLWPPEVLMEAAVPQEMRELEWAPKRVRVLRWKGVVHRSARGNWMIRLMLDCRNGGREAITVSEFLDIEGQASAWSKDRAQRIWRAFGREPVPTSIEEARRRLGELSLPPEVTIKKRGKYYNIVRWS